MRFASAKRTKTLYVSLMNETVLSNNLGWKLINIRKIRTEMSTKYLRRLY